MTRQTLATALATLAGSTTFVAGLLMIHRDARFGSGPLGVIVLSGLGVQILAMALAGMSRVGTRSVPARVSWARTPDRSGD